MGEHGLPAVQHDPNKVILMRNELNVVLADLDNRIYQLRNFFLERHAPEAFVQMRPSGVRSPQKR